MCKVEEKWRWSGGFECLTRLWVAEATLEAPEVVSVVNRMVSGRWDEGSLRCKWGPRHWYLRWKRIKSVVFKGWGTPQGKKKIEGKSEIWGWKCGEIRRWGGIGRKRKWGQEESAGKKNPCRGEGRRWEQRLVCPEISSSWSLVVGLRFEQEKSGCSFFKRYYRTGMLRLSIRDRRCSVWVRAR